MSLPESVTEPRVLVRLGTFERGEISDRLTVSADLEAVYEADVYPEISGVVERLAKREGDFVAKGKPVVELVDDQRALVVETKKILLDQARTRSEQAALALRETDQTVAQKRLSLEEAEAEYARLERLSRGGAGLVSHEELEAKRFARDRLRIDLESIALQKEKQELESAAAEQTRRLAEVDLETAKLDLSHTILVAPIDGHVTMLELKPGELVSPSAPAFHIADVRTLRARLHVPQRDLRRLGVGQAVRLRTDVWPAERFPGIVSVINPVIDPKNGTIDVLVDVEPSERLKPGLFVSGEIILDTIPEAVLAPKRAVSWENQQAILYLVEEGDIARRYTLVPGYSDGERIQVKDLVDARGRSRGGFDARLVVVGHDKLEDGARVEIEAPNPSS